jgi:hypothetical protein
VKNRDQSENTGKKPEETRENANQKKQLATRNIFEALVHGR